jgi:arabinan endo-1,5-alpha-L-arabinosidase
MYRSKDLFNWRRAGSVFAIDLPTWSKEEIPTARGIWAPDLSYFGGVFHLYYTVSTFGKNRSCIGHATNVTLDADDPRYRWTDHGKVIETQPSDNWNAIDPNVAIDEKGQPWLTLGSHWSGIKLRRLNDAGEVSADDNQLYSLAKRPNGGAIEAPYLIRREGFYYLFVSFDQCCRGVNSTYNIRVGRSKESITGPYVDRDGKPMLEGGATMVLQSQGTVRGPGHCAVLHVADKDFLVHHFYDATNNGIKTLQIRPLTWDKEGWPVAGEPLTASATTKP